MSGYGHISPEIYGNSRHSSLILPSFFFFRSDSHFVNLLRSPGIDSQPGGIDCSESIPMLLKRLQIRALVLTQWKCRQGQNFFKKCMSKNIFDHRIHMKTERKKALIILGTAWCSCKNGTVKQVGIRKTVSMAVIRTGLCKAQTENRKQKVYVLLYFYKYFHVFGTYQNKKVSAV